MVIHGSRLFSIRKLTAFTAIGLGLPAFAPSMVKRHAHDCQRFVHIGTDVAAQLPGKCSFALIGADVAAQLPG